MTAMLKLPVTVQGTTKTINDLPFNRANLAFWVNGNGAPAMAGFPDRTDKLIDRASLAEYVPAGTGRILAPESINGIAVMNGRFTEDGTTSGAAGYPIPTSFVSDKVAVAGVTRRGAAATDSLNSILYLGTASNTNVVYLLRYFQVGIDFVIRRVSTDASPTVRAAVVATEWDAWLAEVNYLTGAVTLTVNDTVVQAVLPTTSSGSPVLPASPVAMIAGLSVNQFRGVMSDLVGFDDALSTTQRAELLAYLRAKRNALNA